MQSAIDLSVIRGIDLSAILSLVGAYTILVSAIDLNSYWRVFNLNIFEYLDLNDILTNAIQCFLELLFFWAFMIIFGAGGTQIMEMWPARHGGVADVIFWIMPIVIFDLLLIVVQFVRHYTWYIIVSDIIYFLIPLVVSVTFIAPLGNIKYIIDLLPNPIYRFAVLLIVSSAPFLALVNGRSRALSVKHRKRQVLYVDPRRSALQLSIDDDHPVRYLGRLGEFFVLYESASDRLIIVQTEQLSLVPVWEDLSKKIILDGAKSGHIVSASRWTSEANKPVTDRILARKRPSLN